MSKKALVFNYFPIAGRSTAIRASVALAGDDFNNNYSFLVAPVQFQDWLNPASPVRNDRVRFPTNDLPSLVITDDRPDAANKSVVMCETMAIMTYIGQITGFWPTDALEVARCIEIFATVEQFLNGPPEGPNDCALVPSMSIQDEEKKLAMRRGPVTDRVKIYFGRANDICGSNGFAVGNKTTIVDFFLVAFFLGIKQDQFEGIDGKVCESFGNICKITERVMTDEKMKKVMNSIFSS